jgi:hypothetical protein
MQKYDVHFCLVSKQPLPNLIPALDQNLRPQKVVLFTTNDMARESKALSQILTQMKCKVSKKDISPYDVKNINSVFLDAIAEHEEESIALNVTGGTKIMSLRAFDCFRDLYEKKEQGLVFYVDTANNQYIGLFPDSKSSPLPDVLKVEDYLKAYGYQIIDSSPIQVPKEEQKLAKFLVDNSQRLDRAIGNLNFLASNAKGGQLFASIPENILGHEPSLEILQAFQKAQLLSFDNGKLIFRDEDARFFANGGWLEQYTLSQCNKLKGEGKIFDHKANAQVITKGVTKNEFDLVFTVKNKLRIIECKTSNLHRDSDKQDISYKITALKDQVGGVFGKAMLVSYHQPKPEIIERCKGSNIKVVCKTDLPHLKDRIWDWAIN